MYIRYACICNHKRAHSHTHAVTHVHVGITAGKPHGWASLGAENRDGPAPPLWGMGEGRGQIGVGTHQNTRQIPGILDKDPILNKSQTISH